MVTQTRHAIGHPADYVAYTTNPVVITLEVTMKYVWDNSLQQTAEVLFVINRGGHASVESLRDYIKFLAEKELKAPGYMGTGGWYVSSYRPEWADGDTLYMLTTVMAYTIQRYLDENR